MDFPFIVQSLPVLLKATIMTIELTVVSLVVGSALGLLIAIMKLSKVAPIRWVGSIYTWIFRGTPMILQLSFFYFACPAFGLQLSALMAAFVGLSLNTAAYLAEIFRGGILSIDKGQFEAAKALSFNYIQTMWKIVIPQTFRAILPAIGNEFITLLKDTALVSTIAMTELFRAMTQIASTTFKIPEMYITAALFYLVLTTVFTVLFSKLEKKVSIYV